MAEEFLQGGVSCGGSWWNSPRNLFSSSPCSLASNDVGSFGWPPHEMLLELKSVRPSDDSASDGSSPPVGGTMTINSDDWNQDRDTGRSEENYSNYMLDSVPINTLKHSVGVDQQQPLTSISSSAERVATCPGLSAGFPLSSASYSYASSLLQTLFDTDSQPQQSLLDNQIGMNTYPVNSNGLILPSLPKAASPMVRQHPTEPLWNSTAAALSSGRSTFLPSPQSHFISSSLTNQKPHIHSTGAKQREQGKDLATVVKKATNEPAFKRPRIETPSPLPTFKVRKEKLGDRITALQQLVSPFGKTDTASVLHEAIEYIKFLHDQVNALSTPYLKYGSPPVQRQQGDKAKDEEGLTKELKTRGLCLVPISSTFPVAAETTTDFWTPTFGGSFR